MGFKQWFFNEAKKNIIIKNMGYELVSSEGDEEGSYVELLYRGTLVGTGDFDSSGGFFMTFPNVRGQTYFKKPMDIINYAKKNKITQKYIPKKY